jgi:hypothetical protein
VPDIVSTAALPLLHIPPAVASDSVAVLPTQILLPPKTPLTTGNGFTVTAVVAIADPQLPEIAYVIVAEPAAAPVTTPVLLTVATNVLLLLQLPPVTASANVMVASTHSVVVVPVIVPADPPDVTLIVAVVIAVPHAFETA